MSNASDFIIENGVLTKYVGPGGDVVIPEGVTKIGDEAFAQCKALTGVIMSDTVKTIGSGSFFWCRNLKRVQLGKHVEKIDVFAFNSCDQLKEITIGESVKVIEIQAFGGCLLSKITILGADLQIHATAFKDNGYWYQILAPNLPIELIPKDEKFNAALGFLQMWADGENINTDVAAAYAAYIKRIKKKLIDDYVFQYEKVHALQYILHQKLVKKTEIDALIERTNEMKMPEMTSLLMKYLDEEFGTGFENALDRKLTIEKEQTRKAVTEERLKAARKNPNSEIRKLWTVKKLPNGTCRLTGYKGTLDELTIPEDVDGYPVAELGNRTDIFANDEGYKMLKRIHLPSTLRLIGKEALSRTSIENLIIPEGVEKIDKCCFKFCKALKSVTFPQSIKEIGVEAFSGCRSLEIINIPASIPLIPKVMFDSPYSDHDCPNLKHVYIEGRETVIENGVFSATMWKNPKNLTIHAPAGSYAEEYAKENNIPFVAEG